MKTVVPLFRLLDEMHPDSLANDFCSDENVIDNSVVGILEAIVRKTAPNTVPNYLNQEFQNQIKKRITDSIDENMPLSKLAKFMKYRTYSHTSNKLLSGLPAGPQISRPSLICMWGPLSSYFNSRKLSHRNAFQNKIEISNYIENKTGMKYSDITSVKREEANTQSISEYKSNSTSIFVDEHLSNQKFETFIHETKTSSRRNVLDPVAEEINSVISNDINGFSNITKGHRILNIKSIVENGISR
jgi:hypothetical protein